MRNIISEFDKETSENYSARFNQEFHEGFSENPIMLPSFMSLIPYFFATIKKDEIKTKIITTVKEDCILDSIRPNPLFCPVGKDYIILIQNEKVDFAHKIIIPQKGDIFYRQSLSLKHPDVAISLFSAGTKYIIGWEGNEINKIGFHLQSTHELFANFLSLPLSELDENYDIIKGNNEIIITPKFDISKSSFDDSIEGLVKIYDKLT